MPSPRATREGSKNLEGMMTDRNSLAALVNAPGRRGALQGATHATLALHPSVGATN